MVNVQNFRFALQVLPLVLLCFTGIQGRAQTLEIQSPSGKISFKLIENQPDIIKYLVINMGDSVVCQRAVNEYAFSLQTNLAAMPVADTHRLVPAGLHLRGALSVPIDITPEGKRILRFDRMFIVHGRSTPQHITAGCAGDFRERLKKELYLRLCDTVIKQRYNPLPDTLRDRYGRPDHHKLRLMLNGWLDSLAARFEPVHLTPEELLLYENGNGLPEWDGKFLVIGTLTGGEETLNTWARLPAAIRATSMYWKKVQRE